MKQIHGQRPARSILTSFPLILLLGVLLLCSGCGLQSQKSSRSQAQAPTATRAPSKGIPISFAFIRMIDTHTGWAWSLYAQTFRTTDGGLTWKDVSPYTLLDSSPQEKYMPGNGGKVYILNASTVWIALNGSLGGTATKFIFRTTDGGNTWHKVISATSQESWVRLMSFADAQNGWILCSGVTGDVEPVYLLRTTDGGQTWGETTHSDSSSQQSPGQLPLIGTKTGMTFINATTGWITGTIPPGKDLSHSPEKLLPTDAWLYITHDGGQTWQHQSLNVPANQSSTGLLITAPTFFTAQDGMLPVYLGAPNVSAFDAFVTHDGGKSWHSTSIVYTPDGSTSFLPMYSDDTNFIDIQHGWVATRGLVGDTPTAIFYVTNDSGQHWGYLAPGTHFTSLTSFQFVSPNSGLAVDFPYMSGSPHLLKTTDGGHTWQEQKAVQS